MVIADDEIDTKSLGIFYFLDSLDTTVEDDNQFDTCCMGKVYSFRAYSISLVITVVNIVFYVGIELLQELVY